MVADRQGRQCERELTGNGGSLGDLGVRDQPPCCYRRARAGLIATSRSTMRVRSQ
jgi:hypothetical protein